MGSNPDQSAEPSIKVTAHIPTEEYGYLEFSGDEKDLNKIESLYNRYTKNPLTLNAGVFVEKETFTGERVLYNAVDHEYKTLDGKPLVSGSQFAASKGKPFNKGILSKAVAKKNCLDQQTVLDMWEGNGNVSATFGTALHLAMEQWFRYRSTGTDKQYHLVKHPFLRTAVESFPYKDEHVYPEAFVSDVANLRVGQIDGLLVTSDSEKIAKIIDYKSDSDVEKNLDKHTWQLNFYRWILEAHGWSITGLEIWNYTSEWKKYELELKNE